MKAGRALPGCSVVDLTLALHRGWTSRWTVGKPAVMNWQPSPKMMFQIQVSRCQLPIQRRHDWNEMCSLFSNGCAHYWASFDYAVLLA